MKEKGLILVYTGDGKGKSTAAMGQVIRAAGHGFKIGWVSFFKDPPVFHQAEFNSLQKLDIDVFFFARKHPYFYKNLSFDEVRGECLKGVEFVKELFADETWDMLVLDEINITMRDGFLKEKEILSLLEAKPKNLDLILTGRGATEKIIEKADLVSEVKNVKHHYDQGVKLREGIEY